MRPRRPPVLVHLECVVHLPLYTGEQLAANPMQPVGRPELAKALPMDLPRTAGEAVLETVAQDQEIEAPNGLGQTRSRTQPRRAPGRPARRRASPGRHRRHPHDRRRRRGHPRQRQRVIKSAACQSRLNCCRLSRRTSSVVQSGSLALQRARRTSRTPPYRDGPLDPPCSSAAMENASAAEPSSRESAGLQACRPRRAARPRRAGARAAPYL
jgi:hypothetical protein